MTIRNIKHKGLRNLHEKGNGKGLEAKYIEKCRRILAHLEVSEQPQDMALPGYNLHAIPHWMKDGWAVTVAQNWRITFRFVDSDACDIDFGDYH